MHEHVFDWYEYLGEYLSCNLFDIHVNLTIILRRWGRYVWGNSNKMCSDEATEFLNFLLIYPHPIIRLFFVPTFKLYLFLFLDTIFLEKIPFKSVKTQANFCAPNNYFAFSLLLIVLQRKFLNLVYRAVASLHSLHKLPSLNYQLSHQVPMYLKEIICHFAFKNSRNTQLNEMVPNFNRSCSATTASSVRTAQER